MLYKNLPKAVGLRRVTLHKSLNPADGRDTVYLLLVECSNFMDHVGEAANLLPILRGRICGYTGMFRVADSFWRQPSHAGRDNQDHANENNKHIAHPDNHPKSPIYHNTQRDTTDRTSSFLDRRSPTSPKSLPDMTGSLNEKEGRISISPETSPSIEEKSSTRSFFASLFNLW